MSYEDPMRWIVSGDTGISSKTIWSVMMGVKPADASVPLDPSDFGRCYRLLKAIPSWRSRLGEVARRYPAWTELVSAWGEVEALYESELNNDNGMAPKTYRRIQELIRDRR